MRCPFCGNGDTEVLETRHFSGGAQIRRKRRCKQCGRTFLTLETVALTLPRVIKRDGTREEFDDQKILRGLERAAAKRSIPEDTLEEIVEKVKQRFLQEGLREVTSERIGEEVLRHLKDVDFVAYIRFASVYRKFETLHEFLEELRNLMGHDICRDA
ncbi:MAG TPA: transcriptional repressor NrdR [Bacillaceae bacterium]|nr:transcriptional repressor NrdR [Bacillaceae bacterium]